MPTNNYFYCDKEPFFFDDKSEQSTSSAFEQAMAKQSGKITVYAKPRFRGAWDDLTMVVGDLNIRLVSGRAAS